MADVYNRGKHRLSVEDMDVPVGLTAMLLNASFSYDPDNDVVADISANEISGSGYSRQTLTGVTVTEDDSGNLSAYAANQAAFGSIVFGETVASCVVFVTTGTHLLAHVSLTNTATNGQAFTVQFNGASPGTFMELVNAGTPSVYNRGKQRVGDSVWPIPLTAMLLNASYSFDADHNSVSDISANEIAGAGYSRQALTTEAADQDSGNDRENYSADQVAFGAIVTGETVAACVIFVTSGEDLICHVPLTPTATNGQAFGVDFDGSSPGDFMRLHETDPG